MIIPRDIREGDTIGVSALSGVVNDPMDYVRFENARHRLSERGYRVIETSDVYSSDEFGRCSPASTRAAELSSLLTDNDVSLILFAKGRGYQYEVLPYVDWSEVEDNPKWIQGYSYNTTILFKVTAEHDIATVYCGNYSDFGMDPWHRSVTENLEFLEGKRFEQESFEYHSAGFTDRITGLEPCKDEEPSVWGSSVGDCSFSGRLIGGSLEVLGWFLRTKSADPMDFIDRYASDGIIWYIETYGMTGKAISDTLRDMADDGWFLDCTGFVFGRPMFYSCRTGFPDLVAETLSDLEVPVLTGADVGHKAPRMTFINGAKAEFEFHGGSCTLSYDLR